MNINKITKKKSKSKTNNNIFKKDNEIKLKKKYLEKILIITTNNKKPQPLNSIPELSSQILNSDIINFNETRELIHQIVYKTVKNTLKKKKKSTNNKLKWIKCKNDCFKILSELIKKELNSTVFMLRILSNSVIDITNGDLPLIFKYNNTKNERLSSLWLGKNNKGDHRFFNLLPLEPKIKQSRLIMGFGPSSSGKTFWVKNIIKLFSTNINKYPKSFLSIDGGLVREFSFVYQCIIEELKIYKSVRGFSNLISLNLINKSLFLSRNIKKNIINYLNKNNSYINIYVTETLGKPFQNADNIINKFIKITGDKKWTCLYIWQHKFKKNCNQPKDLKCMSTSISGKSRELVEGKKYSKKAYYISEKKGIQMLINAPSIKISIHNSGGEKYKNKYNKSIITEYSNELNTFIFNTNKLKEFNAKYERILIKYAKKTKKTKKTKKK